MKLFLGRISSKIKSIWQRFLKLSLFKKGLVLVLILIVIFAVFKFAESKKEVKPVYQTTAAEKGTLISSITSSGTITSANSASISTNASGIVKEIYVKDGDYVTAGQSIAALELDQVSQQKATAAYASYLSAQASLNSAQANINSLQSALFKANQTFLNGKGSSSTPDTSDPTYIQQRADWLQAEANYNNQQTVIAAAQANLNSASLSMNQTSSTITAPIAGYISGLTITAGLPIKSASSDSTSNTSGTTVGVVKLADTNPQASVSLTEIDVTKVKIGQKVSMTLDALSDKSFTGKVVSIDTTGSVSSGVTSYPVVIAFDTSIDTIYPNMGVTANIITDIKDDVLIIPTAAVQTINGEKFVRVKKGDQVTQVSVTTGNSNDTQTEVTSGLKEGELVVTGSVSMQIPGGQTSSPFGNSGFGGATRATSIGGAGGGAIRIQQR